MKSKIISSVRLSGPGHENQKSNSNLRKEFYAVLLLLMAMAAQAQQKILTLDGCHHAAAQHYPLSKKRELIEKSRLYTISNISKSYLPQIGSLSQVTYQSDVTEIPFSIPGVDTPEIDQLQFKSYTELTQLIYDGGTVRQRKNAETARRSIETQKLEVDLYTLKERVNNLYFGLLVNTEQQKQNELLQDDLTIGLKSVEAQIANGTSFRSNADLLQAELLKARQQSISLENNRKAYLNMLGLLIGETLDENTLLQKPDAPLMAATINRPELGLFNSQNESLDLEKKLIRSGNRPKLNFFAQAGIANPGLNMFEEGVQNYYIGGLRLTWNLSYTSKKQKEIIDLSKLSNEADREVFLFNTNQALAGQNAEIDKLRQQLAVDDDIVALRANVKKASLAQLQNGVINTSDYLREVNEENLALQNKSIHETELLLAQYREKITRGN